MVKMPTLRIDNVTKSTSYAGESNILMNADYGGASFAFGGIGRVSRWSLAMDNHDGQLNDNTKNNGTVMENRDEVKIYIKSPSDSQSAPYTLWMHGYITKSKRKIQQNNDRVVYLSGLDLGTFWAPDRLFEKFYRLNPTRASTVIKDALAKWHPNLNNDVTQIAEITQLIYKDFIVCTPVECVSEVCQAANCDMYIPPTDIVELFSANSKTLLKGSSAKTFTESDIVNDCDLWFSSEEAHFDEIKFRSNNPMYAPNATTPGGSFCDSLVYWRLRNPDHQAYVYFDPLFLDPAFNADASVRAAQNMVFIGQPFAGAYNTIGIALRTPLPGPDPNGTKLEVYLAAPRTAAGSVFPALGLTEVDWDSFNFIIANGWNGVTSFKIVLYEGDGTSGFWTSKDLVSDLSVGEVKIFSVLLPDNQDVEGGYWTKTGNPTKIDQVGFIFRGGSYGNTTYIAGCFFQGETKATATKAGAPAHKRQKVFIERTVTDPTDARNIANAELTRLQDPALLGNINVEGSIYYNKPAYSATFDFPNDGIYAKLGRCDMFVHKIIENEWTTDIYLAPLLVKNALYNRLAQIALRRNEGQEVNYDSINSMVQNRA